jgi:hypothetical protein
MQGLQQPIKLRTLGTASAQHASSGGRSRLHPPLKGGNLILRPGAVAGHRAVPQAAQDRVTVPGDVVMRPQVEGEPHRPAVALTKERLDVSREADRLVGGQDSPSVDVFPRGDYGSRALVTSLPLLDRQRFARLTREGPVELAARADRQLGEDLVQVVLDGPRADEQSGADLWVREPVAGEPRDLTLLSR